MAKIISLDLPALYVEFLSFMRVLQIMGHQNIKDGEFSGNSLERYEKMMKRGKNLFESNTGAIPLSPNWWKEIGYSYNENAVILVD